MPPLPLLVFVVGTGSLGAEIAAVRLLAPYFGASTIVWAHTIGVVLVALSVGYWLGGRAADRRPDMRSLCLVTLGGSLLLALVPFAADPLLDLGVGALDSIDAGAFFGSLLAVLVLVAVPVLVLGAVSPWAIRIAVGDVGEAGRVAGRLYAISTAGSLFGTLVSALALIPLLGTRRTFLVLALGIALIAVAGLRPVRRYALAPAAIAALIALPVGTLKAAENGSGSRLVYETDTQYQYARVVDRLDGSRALELNEGQAQHSLREPGTVLTGDVWDGHLVLPFLARERAPTAGCSRTPASTAWSSTPSCRASDGASSTCATRGFISTTRTRARSCAGSTRATKSSRSTRTASPTSRSISRRSSSSRPPGPSSLPAGR